MKSLVAACVLIGAAPAWSDAPLPIPLAKVCSSRATACAARDHNGRSAVIWRNQPGGARAGIWRARIDSPALIVSDDGRSLVEIYAGGNLLNLHAGLDTIVLVFHRPGTLPVPVRLRAVIARPENLPLTASHRAWAIDVRFDHDGSFVVETIERRALHFDPSNGQLRSGTGLRSLRKCPT